MRNIRQAALGTSSDAPNGAGIDRDKARALMLAISPSKEASQGSNFKSASGVVHINSAQDWSNFEAESDDNASDKSIEEILGGRSTRGSRRKTSAADGNERSNH